MQDHLAPLVLYSPKADQACLRAVSGSCADLAGADVSDHCERAKTEGGEIHRGNETALVNTDVRGRSYVPKDQALATMATGWACQRADNLTTQALVEAQNLEQFVVGEADAKMMRTHQGQRVAYNMQTAVDSAHCLILHHKVTDHGTGNQQLVPMATAA